MDEKERGQMRYLLGGALIVLGILLLLGRTLGLNWAGSVWPFFIIVPGVLLLMGARENKGPAGESLAIMGGMVTAVGLLLLYQDVTGHWASWAYAWALVVPTSVGLGQIYFGSHSDRPHTVAQGQRLATIGMIIFAVGVVFFELVIGISGFGLGRFGWPALLIGLGLFFLLRNYVPKRGDG